MSALINSFLSWPISKQLRSSNNDDLRIDRLNHRVTVGLILICVFVSSTNSFVNNRISCWIPTELRHPSYSKYIDHYCYISNTYYIHTHVTPPRTDEQRRQEQICKSKCKLNFSFIQNYLSLGYYQWVPILLLLMALGFYSPRMFWRSLNSRSGINIQYLVQRSQSKTDRISQVRKNIQYYCKSSENQSNRSAFNFRLVLQRGKPSENYLVTIYFLTRILYLINSIVQLVFLNVLLGHRGHSWLLNIDIIKSIALHGNPLLDSPYFPRVTLCDVPIREIAKIHRYTVQCTLPVNMLNEKIFIFLSFWLVYVILSNIINLISWIFEQRKSSRLTYIEHYLKWSTITFDQTVSKEELAEYFNSDVIFLLRLIGNNTSEIQATKLFDDLLANKNE